MSHSHGSTTSQPDPKSVAAGHEVSDAMAKSLVVFTVTLTITLIVVVAMTLVLFKVFTAGEDQAASAEYATSPLTDSRPPSPAPPLQPSEGVKLPDGRVVGDHLTLPYQDWQALKAEYDRLADSYGSEMMADHTVHQRIMVDAAIALLADQGFPQNTATDIPTPMGPAHSVPTPYSPGGRGSNTGVAAPPGVPQE